MRAAVYLLVLLAGQAWAETPLERGEYLVRGLGHCGACHTPRNALQAERADAWLQGGQAEGWQAPALTGNALAHWQLDELSQYLRSGRAAGQPNAAGPMARVIEQSLSHLSDADLNAIAFYLEQVPGPATAPVALTTPALLPTRGEAREADSAHWSGAQLFDAWCASCHQPEARGRGAMPTLAGTVLAQRVASGNLVRIILDGTGQAEGPSMPGFADELSDEQVSRLVTALGAPPVTAAEVARQRSATHQAATTGWLAVMGVMGAAALWMGWALRRRRPH
ncbi:c-type cytochrome [Pseudomonas sp. KNUC1026]|uniref:c-type cytochrome n=1 Tax=Pseudomonas sp. KNUC1026 TaxID=2893890 RepID=UPI001F3E8662|nr:cytochrome c [Pseudomonas sp. KNUC1026]UFH51052.1 cytochrome c [Pseudomonas sp. KNUC1026]